MVVWGAATLPLIILIARIVETSLETVRTIYINRGHANLAGWIGIVKTGIWLLSTGIVITNLGDYWNLFAYLAGYGLGTLLGMQIENMISLGHVIVRLITPADPQPLITELSTLGYGMTRIEGSGSFSHTVSIIFMIVPRKELGRLLGVLSIPVSGHSLYGRRCAQHQGRGKDLPQGSKEQDPGILRVITCSLQ